MCPIIKDKGAIERKENVLAVNLYSIRLLLLERHQTIIIVSVYNQRRPQEINSFSKIALLCNQDTQ